MTLKTPEQTNTPEPVVWERDILPKLVAIGDAVTQMFVSKKTGKYASEQDAFAATALMGALAICTTKDSALAFFSLFDSLIMRKPDKYTIVLSQDGFTIERDIPDVGTTKGN